MATITSNPALRPRTDRFLISILVGLTALLVTAGVVVVLSRQPALTLPAGTPGATVQQFYAAIQQGAYEQAYTLLSDAMTDRPPRDAFVQYHLSGESSGHVPRGDRVQIGEVRIAGDTAFVMVLITHYYNNPSPLGGGGEWQHNETFTLHHEGDTWRITQLPYGYMPSQYYP